MPSEQPNSPKKQQRLVAALPTFWTLLTGFLTASAAAGGIALINLIGNLGGFAGPYAIGWIKGCDWRYNARPCVAGCLFDHGGHNHISDGSYHDSKIEMAGSRMMAE